MIPNKSKQAPQQSHETEVHWIQHMDAYGFYYYEDTINGTVTYMAPAGEEYKRWVDTEA